MKRMLPWLLILVVIAMSLLSACKTTTTQTTQSTTKTTTSVTTTKTSTTAPGTTTQAKWWDKFGTPQYGGSIAYVSAGLMGVNFDTYIIPGSENSIWFETLFEPDWTMNPETDWFMSGNFAPDQRYSGNLAESWSFTDATTLTVKIRQGIKWQNKAPANGREFVAADVAAHYNRVLGFDGKTPMSPMYQGSFANVASITATEKYTVVFKFKKASAQNFQTLADRFTGNQFESPEFAALDEKARQDPTNACGTGPWMYSDFTAGSGFKYVKNPDYWGTDPRYPKNKTPYADKLSLVIIPDESTRVAALRSGQVDTMGGGGNTTLDWKQQGQLIKTNVDLQYTKVTGGAVSIVGRLDKAPFTDVRVRKALNMSIDRKAIANSIYGGTTEGIPVGLVSATMVGYVYPYSDWSQSLKDEYAYNPTAAKKLLADAGFPNGFSTNVVTTAANTELLQVFKAYFQDIGVNMEIRPMDTAALESFIRDGKHDQMASGGGAQSFPPTRIVDLAYSKGTDSTLFGLNNTPDTNYDALHDAFLAATDANEAMKIMQNMDKYFIENHWAIEACERYNYVMWQPWLKGYSGEGAQWNQGVLWSRLWIDSSLKK